MQTGRYEATAGAWERALREPVYASVWRAARAQVAADPSGWTSVRILLPQPSDEERRALEQLLGRAVPTSRVAVLLGELDAALVNSPLRAGLLSWLARLDTEKPSTWDTETVPDEGRAAAIDRLRSSRHANQPWFQRWVSELVSSGQLARMDVEDARELAESVVTVLDQLPAHGIARSQLATSAAGNPRALEEGPLARLVLWALALWAECPIPERAGDARALWERYDVLNDDLTSLVVTLGVRPSGGDPLAIWLRSAANAGHPVVLSRRDVSRLSTFPDVPVYICEHTGLLHLAAARLGPRCPALLCVQGRPLAAFWALTDRLRRSGCELWYHGDLDPAGIELARGVLGRAKARPWRMSASDYIASASSGPQIPLKPGRIPETPWDPELRSCMQREGLAVAEEAMLAPLMADLEAEARRLYGD